MNRMIIDSNAMQAGVLRSYLSASSNNLVVLNDYASMEAYKGDTLTSIYRSMEIVSEFPRQVIVLKTTGRICALSGRSQGLQRRMIDERQTREFPTFCKQLRAAREGNAHFQEQLLENGRVASEQMDRILADVPALSAAIKELRRTFSKEELRIIRLHEPFTVNLIEKSMNFIIQLTFNTLSRHPNPPRRIRSIDELQNTFLFRHSIATYVWSLDWISRGGADGVRSDRMRNDVVDVIFATYAMFFDGMISNDEKAQRTYRHAKFIMQMLTSAKFATDSDERVPIIWRRTVG